MLFDSLTHTEKQLSFQNIIKECGMHFISNVIFTHFSQKILNQKPYNAHHLKSINKTVADIILARQKITKEEEENTEDEDIDVDDNVAPKLDELPKELISKCASFLRQSAYNNFLQVNRKCYLGCHTPFSLRFLFVAEKQSSPLPLNKLKELRSLDITTDYFNRMVNAKLDDAAAPHFSNLKRLTLANCASNQMMDTFLKQKCINLGIFLIYS